VKQSFDVVVAGGGPAGSAVAVDLSRRGFQVALIESALLGQFAYDEFRVGETLPPEIRVSLTKLGVWEQFLATDRLESYGIRSAWETPVPRHRDFLFNPYGCGWHVDRAVFDAMLVGAAARAGVELLTSVRLNGFDRDTNGGWLLEIVQKETRRQLCSNILVEATGRKASIAGKLGCRGRVADRLIGAVAVLERRELTQWTLIEAVENGWWYSAPVPGDRMIFAYMTDSDLWEKSGWRDLLKSAPLTWERADTLEMLSPIRIVSAASVLREPVHGPNWIAAGDAALAFDPLSGLGVHKAIESGLRSSAAIARHLEGDSEAMMEYENWTVDSFRSYLSVRRQFYRTVDRWPGSPFWERRRSDNLARSGRSAGEIW
jgi:flavin-dependent dehydrogenase